MIWLLDTSTLVFAARRRPEGVRRRLTQVSPEDVGVPSIAIAELWYGAEKSEDPARKRAAWEEFLAPFSILAFDRSAAEMHARLRLLLRHAPIGERDLFIAAIAASNKLTVVTGNSARFRRVPDLVVEDWSAPASA